MFSASAPLPAQKPPGNMGNDGDNYSRCHLPVLKFVTTSLIRIYGRKKIPLSTSFLQVVMKVVWKLWQTALEIQRGVAKIAAGLTFLKFNQDVRYKTI